MDSDTRAQLFGKCSNLTKRMWAPGQRKVFYLVKPAQAVVATMLEEGALKVDDKKSYAIDMQSMRHRGELVYVLNDASRKLKALEKVAPSSAVHRQALELSKVFGTTYYLSDSVVEHLEPGMHFFAVGKMPVQKMRFNKFSLDGSKLTWSTGAVRHAMLGKRPVFVLSEVAERIGRAQNAKEK